MGLFGLFKRKKKEAMPSKDMPKPPTPPSTLKPSSEMEKQMGSPQHVDDLGMGFGSGKTADIKPPESLELPELEFPTLEIPSLEEEEIKSAVEKEARPSVQMKKAQPMRPRKQEVPEKMPDIGHVPQPRMPEHDVELVTMEEPIELRPTPHAKGPVFIRSDQFKLIKENIDSLREVLGKSEETLNNVVEIKNREDSEYEAWHSAAEAMQRKLLYIDNMLFEK